MANERTRIKLAGYIQGIDKAFRREGFTVTVNGQDRSVHKSRDGNFVRYGNTTEYRPINSVARYGHSYFEVWDIELNRSDDLTKERFKRVLRGTGLDGRLIKVRSN